MVTAAYDIIKMQQALHLMVCLMSWNVRSLHTAGSLTVAAKELARYTLDLVGVKEVTVRAEDTFSLEKETK